MIIAIILILFAVALFLVFHDDHDDSYTRSENKAARKEPKSSYQKKVTVKPSPLMEPRTVVPEEKQFRPDHVGTSGENGQENRQNHRQYPASDSFSHTLLTNNLEQR